MMNEMVYNGILKIRTSQLDCQVLNSASNNETVFNISDLGPATMRINPLVVFSRHLSRDEAYLLNGQCAAVKSHSYSQMSDGTNFLEVDLNTGFVSVQGAPESLVGTRR